MQHDATSHRQYPRPETPWLMKQTWENLLFAHWPVPIEMMRSLIPAPIKLDTFDGVAWIGLVPFEITTMHVHGVPPIPGVSRFPEVNVRTYVSYADKPGVYFFSLDAGHRLAVQAARQMFHLPYYHARFQIDVHQHQVYYRMERTHHHAPPAQLDATYAPVGDVFESVPGSVEAWLTDRYCLYVSHGGQLYRGDIHHSAWPLQRADMELGTNTLFDAYGWPTPKVEPLCHFAQKQETLFWPLAKVDT